MWTLLVQFQEVAMEKFLASMSATVGDQVDLLSKSFAAVVAFVWELTSVGVQVRDQLFHPPEGFVAVGTVVWVLNCMHSLVLLHLSADVCSIATQKTPFHSRFQLRRHAGAMTYAHQVHSCSHIKNQLSFLTRCGTAGCFMLSITKYSSSWGWVSIIVIIGFSFVSCRAGTLLKG